MRQTFQEARAGSREAFEDLFDHVSRVVRHKVDKMNIAPIERIIGDSDLIQITCMEAYRDFKNFKGQTFDEFMAWLFKILFNNMVSLRHVYGPQSKRDIARELPLDDSRTSSHWREALLDKGPSPADELIHAEERSAIKAALGRLPRHYRRVLFLRLRGRLSFKGIAHKIGRSPEAARKLFVRAVRQLKKETFSGGEG